MSRCIVIICGLSCRLNILLIEQQKNQFSALNQWFDSFLGNTLATEFSKQLQPILTCLQGENLLQLGQCAKNLWLDQLSFSNKWIAAPFSDDQHINLVCSFNQIPLNRNSVDCILAPLTLEPFTNYLHLIEEMDRILKPMGYIVLLSINPWSLWGGATKCGMVHSFAEKKITMHTPFHINRQFMQRGYRQCLLNHFFYLPPVNNQLLLKKLSFFNEIGKMLWPFPSGFYCYIAQKYEPIAPTLTAAAQARIINLDSAFESTTSA